MRNLHRVILRVEKNITNILLNAFTKQRKKALGEKVLTSKAMPFYYWSEKIGQFVKEKKENI